MFLTITYLLKESIETHYYKEYGLGGGLLGFGKGGDFLNKINIVWELILLYT